MLKIVSISAGGVIGSLMRYWISGFAHKIYEGSFPWGTLLVNLIGSLLVGILWSASELIEISHNTRLFLFIGIMGSFTTFSAFSLESFHLLKSDQYFMFATNIVSSIIFGIAFVFLGYFAGNFFFAQAS